MAFKIDVTFNGETFTQEVGQFLAANLAEAMTNAVNEAAESSRLRLMEYMGEAFDRPRPITVDSVGILPAKTGSRRSSGWISRSTAARAAPATTKLGPLMPGPAAPLDQFGGLPYGFVSRALASGEAAWIQIRPDQPPALMRRLPGDGDEFEVIALIIKEAHYDKPKLPFHDIVDEIVSKELPEAFARAWAQWKNKAVQLLTVRRSGLAWPNGPEGSGLTICIWNHVSPASWVAHTGCPYPAARTSMSRFGRWNRQDGSLPPHVVRDTPVGRDGHPVRDGGRVRHIVAGQVPRPQPRHQPVRPSNSHTEMQGLSFFKASSDLRQTLHSTQIGPPPM